MAINLLGNLNNVQNSMSGAQTSTQVEGGSSLMRQAATAMLNELRSMMPGDTLSGQLVSKDGNSIQLLLNNNTLLNTALDSDVNIAMGQQISFEVRSNQNGQLTLRPMFTNLSNSSTIMNALNAANIGASDASIEMVDTLMQNSMSIGKDMLTSINRELTMYPDADVKDIVMLHKMDIPVNADNVHQMHLYNNNNQWMLESVTDSAADLTNMLTEALSNGGEETVNILNGLADMLKPASEKTSLEGQAEAALVDTNTAGDGQVVNGQNGEALNQIASDNANTVANMMLSNNEVANINDAINGGAPTNVSSAVNVEAEAEATQNGPQAEANNIDINKFNVFEKLATMPKEQMSDPAVREQIKNSLTELLKDNFLMDPKSIGEEKYVKKYYERTTDLAENLSRLMAENGKADTDFARTMVNVKENTNFMNQMNELYNYVQLPLKMNDSQANGDLYVYARKKGRGTGGEDGKLTALLHLSMEHLGNMDIFLTLQDGQKLSTKFCLEDESMIDFIADHIDELNARLAAKGYDLGTSVVTKMDGPEKSAIDNITAGDGNILLSTQSFDARA